MDDRILGKINGIAFDKLEIELLRSLRGDKTQEQINNLLDFNYNKVSKWENGDLAVTWHEFVQYTQIAQKDLQKHLHIFLLYEGDIFNVADLTSHLLKNLPLDTVSTTIGCSKATLYRWMKGETEPALKFILKIIVLVDVNFLAFFSSISDLNQIPALSDFREVEEAKDIFWRHPLIAAILRVLELKEYENLESHQEGYVSRKLKISMEEEKFLLSLMVKHQFAKIDNNKYVALSKTFYTGGDKKRQLDTLLFWHEKSNQLLKEMYEEEKVKPGQHMWLYNVFTANQEVKDLIRKRTLAYYNDVTAIVSSDSNTGDAVDILLFQLGVQSILAE